MSTVGAVIDRVYRTYLRPPDYQEAKTRVTNALTAVSTDNVLTLGAFAVSEDEQLLRIETLLEVDQELMAVTAYDSALRQVTVARGEEGTTIAAHLANAKVIFDPSYSRASTFEAVADNIISLHPDLYTVSQDFIVAAQHGIAPLADELAVTLVSVWDESFSNTVDYHGKIVDYHPSTGGRAVVTNCPLGSMWVRYRRRMGKPTDETTLLADIGVDERWVNVIMVGAAADLLVGRDISAVHTDWISQSMEAETVRPGTRTTIAGRLAGYRDILIKRFKSEMDTEYKPKVRKTDWTANVT